MADISIKDLSNVLKNMAAILDWYENVKDMNTCNDCGNLECEYRPEIGALVRMNCMFWKEIEKTEATEDIEYDERGADAEE